MSESQEVAYRTGIVAAIFADVQAISYGHPLAVDYTLMALACVMAVVSCWSLLQTYYYVGKAIVREHRPDWVDR